MISNVLRHIGGIEAYGIISIGLFFATFMGVLIWAGRLKRHFLRSMAALPLEEDEPKSSEKQETAYE